MGSSPPAAPPAIEPHQTAIPKKKREHSFLSARIGLAQIVGEGRLLCLVGLLVLAGFIPERQLDPVPEAELVVNYAEIVLDDVFGSAEGIRNFPVLTAFGDELDDGMFTFTGSTGVGCLSDHSCLL
jgi:hypothetical protein